MDMTLDEATEGVKKKLEDALGTVDFHSRFSFGMTKAYGTLGLNIADGDVSDGILDLLFGRNSSWEVVAESDDDSDDSWDIWRVYQVSISSYSKVDGKFKQREFVFYLKFEAYGLSHGKSKFRQWSFVEPKTKEIQVWE